MHANCSHPGLCSLERFFYKKKMKFEHVQGRGRGKRFSDLVIQVTFLFFLKKTTKKPWEKIRPQKIDTSNFNFQKELKAPELKLRRRGAMA